MLQALCEEEHIPHAELMRQVQGKEVAAQKALRDCEALAVAAGAQLYAASTAFCEQWQQLNLSRPADIQSRSTSQALMQSACITTQLMRLCTEVAADAGIVAALDNANRVTNAELCGKLMCCKNCAKSGAMWCL